MNCDGLADVHAVDADGVRLLLSRDAAAVEGGRLDVARCVARPDVYRLRLEHPVFVNEAGGNDFDFVNYRLREADDHGSNDRGLHLEHLWVPGELRGRGLGRLGVAGLYAACRAYGVEKFSIRVGGGPATAAFLRHLGFSDDAVAVQSGEHVDAALAGDVRDVDGGVEAGLAPLAAFPEALRNLVERR